jgi:mannose-6-phosphate isomerase-like protein (cupin superfamily)
VAGDTGEISEGDLVMVPPATDHAIANTGEAELACVSVQSPPVAVTELYNRQMAEVTGYDDDEE